MTALFALVAALALQPADDGPIRTGGTEGEAADRVRLREAIAYAQPLPPGAPTDDYVLVAWCDALVSGHVRLGESLSELDDLDSRIIHLGRLESADFRAALTVARPRQSPAVLAAAEAAANERTAIWARLHDQPEGVRSDAFGLFFGLPGRCEHAARRISGAITTPPASLDGEGLE